MVSRLYVRLVDSTGKTKAFEETYPSLLEGRGQSPAATELVHCDDNVLSSSRQEEVKDGVEMGKGSNKVDVWLLNSRRRITRLFFREA